MKLFPATLTPDGRKVPVKGFRWREDCTDDPVIIASWSQIYPQLKFYGVPCGPENGLLVLDVDVKTNGHETIKNYHLPLTMSQTTRSGGKHYIYKYPTDGLDYGNRTGFDKGLDIRGKNGYIIYYGTDTTPISEAPEWILNHALGVAKKEVDLNNIIKVDATIAQKILETACENIRNAPPGESNNILNIEAYNVGQLLPSNSIDKDYSHRCLMEAAIERGKPEREAQATIKSGFTGGGSAPMTCPFGNAEPVLIIPEIESKPSERWTPTFFTNRDLSNISNLRKPQIFKHWSTEDIHITTADGGTGKTTLKLYEAICLALGYDFLGFKCLGEGRTLYITGEDTKEKLGAMIGIILKQMGLYEDKKIVDKVLNSITVKLDDEMCIITKTKQGFITINHDAINKVMQAVEDLRPKMIVFDPISSFWGSEAALNDMSRAVAKFMSVLVKKSNACIEVINHMGKQSSSNKDMTQFAGRGGTGLPSHARVSKVLRPILDDEFEELTNTSLGDNQSAMICNVNKFSDGSPLYNKPFLIIREGYLFNKMDLIEQKVKEEQNKMSDIERVFTFIKNERQDDRYPTKDIIVASFMASTEKISKDKIVRAIAVLMYTGHMGEKIKMIDNPDPECKGSVYIVTDDKGKEL